VLCGYVRVRRTAQGDPWYDDWILAQSRRVPKPIPLLFEVAWRCGATDAVAKLIADTLRTDKVGPEVVGQATFGQWARDLSANALDELLHAMDESNHAATAIDILEHRLKLHEDEFETWENLALALCVRSELIRGSTMASYAWKLVACKLATKYPGDLATAIMRAHTDRDGDSWFIEHNYAAEVLDVCVETDPAAVWTAILPHLASRHEAYIFSVGFPRRVLTVVPPETVLAWIAERPDERAEIVAKLVGKNVSSDDSLASIVIDRYGARKDVADAFFSEQVSGSWSGPASGNWERMAEKLEGVATRTALPNLRTWARERAKQFRRMAEKDRQREEEEDLRTP
jgi:hypothetical protein